jgi:hypothetical protein
MMNARFACSVRNVPGDGGQVMPDGQRDACRSGADCDADPMPMCGASAHALLMRHGSTVCVAVC